MAGVAGRTPRVALGSVAPTVIRALKTEEVLAAGGSLDEAQRVLSLEIAPIDDLRSTAEYRRRVAANLLARFWIDSHRPESDGKNR
jgi:xanthine dehydrogenase FAD-binding subunit